LGMALVAGKKRVPRPATGKMALRIGFMGRALGESGGESWVECACQAKVRRSGLHTGNRVIQLAAW
jgi:hypothetical protein